MVRRCCFVAAAGHPFGEQQQQPRRQRRRRRAGAEASQVGGPGTNQGDIHNTGGLSRRTAMMLPLLLGLPLPGDAAVAAPELYDRYAAGYDALETGSFGQAFGFQQMRSRLLAKARGSTLEIAAGTGLNLPFYAGSVDQISELVVTDVSGGMLGRAAVRGRGAELDGKVRFEKTDATQLVAAFGSDRFDTVVDTFSLCTMSNPARVLREIAAVLRREEDGGCGALLLEHTRSEEVAGVLGLYQDVTEPVVTAMSKGCVWNMRVNELVTAAGLVIRESETNLLGTVTIIRAVKL